jgi:hypothetical protein
MKHLANNQELLDYLLFLAAELKKRKLDELSDTVTRASRHAATIPSTEFLGESRIALRQVLKEEDGVLTVLERSDLSNVIQQLDDAFEIRK